MTGLATRTVVEPLMITGCGVVSAAGIGLDALADAIGAGRADQPAASAFPEDAPPIPLAAVPDLKVAEHLGAKGTRHLDRTTLLALVACNRALAGLVPALPEPDRARTGVAIGTSTGSIRSSSEFSRETLVQALPYLVRANLFPNSVMNCCAARIAIVNGIRGVNATLAGGQLSSLAALRYARNVIDRGHADRVLAGGVEELSAQSAWAWHLARGLSPGTAVGEGCAVFVAESRRAADRAGRPVLAEVLACEVRSTGGDDPRHQLSTALAGCVERALRRSGVGPDDVREVAPGATGQRGLRALERRGVRAVVGGRPGEVRVAPVLGETFSAGGALQLAALIAGWRRRPPAGGVALVTSVGHDGTAGCLVVRPPAGGAERREVRR
ncbi:3-oxoacyl-ACP synthase [Paractinoplanes deccanensis]|uniref:3-oxoacyl-ACP synthase n=1 Tax=Paractinoplanes deccanensis TaxID=113561 RepID=A0ABQ3XY86_9ACTN|nr:beta-ketoacyl synthase N-terminal-like domain-containing protein [Actinoplanes deccanensis]GID72696.1 3-oxoacyl-ACP synthase [Actinoplanes deccanensis]